MNKVAYAKQLSNNNKQAGVYKEVISKVNTIRVVICDECRMSRTTFLNVHQNVNIHYLVTK